MNFQELWSKYGKSILFPGLIIFIATVYFLLFKDGEQTPHSSIELLSTVEPSKDKQQAEDNAPLEDQPEAVVVDVKGAVKYPGVYHFTTEDRIMDAIEAAGGYQENANPVAINHAQKLSDEMVIYIPKQGEDISEMTMQDFTTNETNTNENGKVNLNTATETELTTLPGIGPSKAASIIAYREENGKFTKLEDLKNVTGIGEKTFEKLQDLITVN